VGHTWATVKDDLLMSIPKHFFSPELDGKRHEVEGRREGEKTTPGAQRIPLHFHSTNYDYD